MTPKRLELLKTLRQQGPLSVKRLAGVLGRNYRNVHLDTAELEAVDLIQCTEDGVAIEPWDFIDAHVRLLA
jgi:predicted transcriptional regulator